MTRTTFDDFSTTSEQYLRHNERCIDNHFTLDTTKIAANDIPQQFPNDHKSKDCKKYLEKEDLIQLDASPKRRLRERKAKTSNTKNSMTEIEKRFGIFGSASAYAKPTENTLLPNESSTDSLRQNAASSKTNNIIPACISATNATVWAGNKDSTSNIQQRTNNNTTSEILDAPTAAILAPSRRKDKIL